MTVVQRRLLMTVAVVVVLGVGMEMDRRAMAQPTGFGSQHEEKAPVMKADVKYINCQSCEFLIREANRAIQKRKKEAKPGKKVTEADVFSFLERICDPDTDEGEWIATLDMVEKGVELKLMDMNTIGFCGSECRTIARACTDLLEEFDYELAEALFKGDLERAALTQKFCRESSKACTSLPPPLPVDRPEGPPFVPMTEGDYKMAKMMQQMKDMGLGGQVFDQDSAQRYIAEHSGYSASDDDDEADEDDYEPAEMEPAVAGGGFSFMDTVDWARREASNGVTSGYRAAAKTARDVYERFAGRFRKDKTEL